MYLFNTVNNITKGIKISLEIAGLLLLQPLSIGLQYFVNHQLEIKSCFSDVV